MGFNFDGAGFDFSTKPKITGKKKSAEPETDYQKRNKQEQDRRKLATCSNYFTTVCFKSENELKEFQKLLGSEKLFYPCCEIEEIISKFKRQSRDWKIKITTEIDKIDWWQEQATFEATCKKDLEETAKILKQRDKESNYRDVYNSRFSFVLVAKDDDDLTDFLTRHKLFRYGERRLNGSKWLADIKA